MVSSKAAELVSKNRRSSTAWGQMSSCAFLSGRPFLKHPLDSRLNTKNDSRRSATADRKAQVLMAELAGMQHRPLGQTGIEVSMLGLGGSHIGTPKVSSKEAVKI